MGEESPGSAEHLPVESTDGCELMSGVTENYRLIEVRVKTQGKSLRQILATVSGYATEGCKVKYTGR